ncbi:MAG: YchF/TatD family DNA exonuclease [Deltaproteobacteria bacterium]|nr:YchF/TatD family DNA exonuclease [Deltaproteobacteria bacterium]
MTPAKPLVETLIDSHCHVSGPEFDSDRDEVFTRARAAGVGAFVVIGASDGLEANEAALKLATTRDDCVATVGLHPHDAHLCDEQARATIREMAAHPKVVAVGETGLDYHYKHSTPDEQRAAFREFVRLARDVRKPLVIHERDAHDDCLTVLREERAETVGGVIHCFTGDAPFAQGCLDLGFYISVSGIVTFKNAVALRDVIRGIPIERLLIETDAPYLAPVPHRGKRNEPAFVVDTAQTLAMLFGVSVNDIARITSVNARRLFRLPGAVPDPKIAYVIRDALYLNITNRCTLACTFCPKFDDFMVKGHYLKLTAEPSIPEVISAIGDPTAYSEVVFCGYGEPTLRLDALLEIARGLRARGARVRLNTDGLANLVHGRDVIPELATCIDSVSVSLNAHNAAIYAKYCPSGPRTRDDAYDAVKAFLRATRGRIADVQATAVTMPDVDIEACRRIAEDELGVRFRARPLNAVG